MFLLKANCDLKSHYQSQLCSRAWTAWRIMLCYVLRGVLLCTVFTQLRRLLLIHMAKNTGQWFIPPYSGFICYPNARLQRDKKQFSAGALDTVLRFKNARLSQIKSKRSWLVQFIFISISKFTASFMSVYLYDKQLYCLARDFMLLK